jgi:PAS domain S-box-containing protein/putative nucleotidyltransferase with HDIG domain
MRVLVAEDNDDSRKLLTKQLHAYGHDVRSTANGEEALAEALKDPPEILVTDILMPEMDGFQLCMEWKLNKQLRGIPVVFYTATYTSDEDEKFALSLGADAFVRKPAEAEEFARVLANVVEKTGSNLPPPPEVAPVAYSGFLMGYSKRLLTKLVTKVAELEKDIAERNRIQDESNLKAQLLDAATDIIIVTELDDWTIRYVNEAGCLNLGYRRDELLGHDLRDFMAPEYGKRLHEAVSDGTSILETAHVRKDGTVMPAEVHARVTDWGGRDVRLAVVRDITERKKAEERLRDSNVKLEQVVQGTLDVIEQIVEASDPYTSGHQRRVAQLAVAIGREMGLPEESCISLVRTAAVIHDIGKTTVPSEILSKPGRLTPEEFGLVKTHSQVGYEIIKRARLPDPVAEVVLQHHERLDGSGYPQGLSGDDILPEAQILAVADVVEAMFSHRPYRPALGIDAALNELSAGRGTRYYPDVVAACTAVFREKGFTFAD